MKYIFLNLGLVLVLAIVFSGLTACSGTSDAGPGTETQAPVNSDYPPLHSRVAQSDMRNFDGTTFKVADRRGKVLLLNMWATWCGPCRAEMPALVKMQDDYRDKDFEVIGLNTDEEPVDLIEPFAKEMNLNYTLVWADTDMQDELLNISKFSGIPQSFVVDRNGALRGVFKGASPQEVAKMKDLVAQIVNE
ncbi:MAG: TlpA family protein disulfide reductase [Blastocatellia bacterium]|nr:TlpA family protein disulfide reductase [Blastocatellia bacterium]